MPAPRVAWEAVPPDGPAAPPAAPAWQVPDPPPGPATAPSDVAEAAVDILPGPTGHAEGLWAGPPLTGRGRHTAPGQRGTGTTALVVFAACAVTAVVTAALVGRGEDTAGITHATGSPGVGVERSVTTPGDATPVADLAPGTCFLDPPVEGSAVEQVTTVDCGAAHDNEVVAVFALDGGPWPGTARVVQDAQQQCRVEGPAAVAAAAQSPADWGFFVFHPTRAAWTSGDRSVQCVAYPLRGTPKTGSLVGAPPQP